MAAVEADAGNFMFNRLCQIKHLCKNIDIPPIIVSPYDAELFGHWWYEGPQFIDYVLRKFAKEQNEIELITPSQYLQRNSTLQLLDPASSSWGDKGYFEVWLNGTNDWIYRHLHRAEKVMLEMADTESSPSEIVKRALNQAGRELMLAQASDWAFIMTTGTMVDYAIKKTKDHLNRFFELSEMIKQKSVSESRLQQIESKDNIFPELDYQIFHS